MRYEDATEFLTGRINYERSSTLPYRSRCFKLQRMEDLLELVGSPHRALRAIHITGTKGKGSCAAMVSSILREAGYRVGLFTSPHLETVRERLVINGAMCEESCFAALIERLIPAVHKVDEMAESRGYIHGPTYFEIVTAAAFLYFAQEGVDFAVLEVGLGGRLDATNVCRPVVAIITSVSFDHTEQLGNSLESIAREKAGIIKPGVRTVSGVMQPGPREVIEEVAGRVQSPVWQLGRDFWYESSNVGVDNSEKDGPARLVNVFDYHFHPADVDEVQVEGQISRAVGYSRSFCLSRLSLPLLGEHQAANASVGITAILELRARGWPISDEAIRSGLARIKWPGRVEVLLTEPVVIVDGAHNEASIVALVDTIDRYLPGRTLRVLFGSSRDKEVAAMLRVLIPKAAQLVFTQCTDTPRAMPASELGSLAQILGAKAGQVVVEPCAQGAWRLLRSRASPGDVLCVTGSLFLVGELRRFIVEELGRPGSIT